MTPRRVLTALTLVAVSAIATASASAQPTTVADLTGTFQMSGKVTVAHNVRGERAGQVVQRAWTFTPQCTVAPCASVRLVRSRRIGADTLTLTLQKSATETYAGTGVFYAPLRCAGRTYPQGQEIPFRITVRVTAVAGTKASAIRATYVNRSRINLTPCIGVLGHDSARYVGQPVAG
jgi:hypothetical protein